MVINKVMVTDHKELSQLQMLTQPVTQLFSVGNFVELLGKPMVAIVGSRKVSTYGRAVTSKLAHALARAGVVIVSGLALGVDSIAHKAALDAGGRTIAILPSGLDKVYPASHYPLAKRITQQGGAVISEYPEGTGSPRKYQFIARNRIIAALSRGVIITEAAAKSGSLHTASFALEQGIEVFAVPGNITSELSVGTNDLIKAGAHPITTAQDVLEVLQIRPSTNPVASDIPGTLITSALGSSIMTTSQLLERTRLQPSQLLQSLTNLEIAGVIQQPGPNSWSLM